MQNVAPGTNNIDAERKRQTEVNAEASKNQQRELNAENPRNERIQAEERQRSAEETQAAARERTSQQAINREHSAEMQNQQHQIGKRRNAIGRPNRKR